MRWRRHGNCFMLRKRLKNKNLNYDFLAHVKYKNLLKENNII